MKENKYLHQPADWKPEKHVPVIEVPDRVTKDELFAVEVTIGKELAHPSEPKHHIRWIDIYFKPDDAKLPYQIGTAEFKSHGEPVGGPDTSSMFKHHSVSLNFKTEKSGTILASSYCNIHGLWQSTKKISVE